MALQMEAIEPILAKICASAMFARSRRLQRFLTYVTQWSVTHAGEPLKEYGIAIGVYDKPASFDPQSDPIIRVEASRLRSRLVEYYAGPGCRDPLIIELPKGSYTPSIRPRAMVVDLPAQDNESIAVLPLQSASGPETEYLCDGITESLINHFSVIPQLRVVPRSVAFRYKGCEIDHHKVGCELNVRLLLTGKILQRGERLSIQAELVDVIEQKQVWGERLNRTMSGLLDVEDEIARHISGQLRLKLTRDEKRRLERRLTENIVAYQLYLKGRYHWSKRTPENLRRAIEYFEQATGEDPLYALAYSGLADSYIVLGWWGLFSPADALDRCKHAARKAIEIDPELVDGYAALGFAQGCDREWDDAEETFQRAIRANSAYWLTYDWYAICLSAVGRSEEAIAAVRRAQQIDPLSLVIHHHAAWIDIQARRYDDAVEQCRKALELDPNYSLGHFWLGFAQSHKSMHDEALRSLQKARELLGGIPYSLAGLAHAFANAGHRPEAEELLQELVTCQRYYVDPYNLAIVHSGLGELERVFECLEKAYRARSMWMACWIKSDPRLDPARSDHRFADLLRRIGVG